MKKILSLTLVLCLCASLLLIPIHSASAVTATTGTTTTDYHLMANAQDGVILHAFNWTYANIESQMQNIATAGYSSVQVSPVQTPKDYADGTPVNSSWWRMYQPISLSFADGGTWLGTKNDFISMCNTAHKYGIKVIVDIVANHMANINGRGGNSKSDRSTQIQPTELYNNDAYWHINSVSASDSSRYNMTQGCIGEPDLNTGSSYVQNAVLNLLKQCVDYGADGFRFDAAKHIELPTDDASFASNYWPYIINGITSYTTRPLYFYGEILNNAGTPISNYTKYMSVTDNKYGDNLLADVDNNDAQRSASSSYPIGSDPNKTVLWAESHDDYMDNQSSDIPDNEITVAWAIAASRKDATSLFLARPSLDMGDISDDTTWDSTEVAKINQFHNYFSGQSENLYYNGDCVINERGNSGVMIANVGTDSQTLNVTVKSLADGAYTDQISGNKYTVTGGVLKGTVPAMTAVVAFTPNYNPPSNTISKAGGPFYGDSCDVTVGLTNAKSGTYQIDNGAVQTFTASTVITIGSGLATNATTTVKLTATDGTKTVNSSYTFTKKALSDRLLGDVNLDGAVTVKDVTLLQQQLAHLVTLPKIALDVSDIDSSSDVSLKDVTLIQKYLAKMNVSYPIGKTLVS
ncbi:MAG: alpha-amylase family glycosyl hydrolase [Bacillota bacterium]|nr:alpha-amylase family glycosyl hydrolase [Bacillota bacterium]